MAGEIVIAKRTNSAFIGTDLEYRLRASGHDPLIIAGVITNNSVEATVRMAGNLEFRTFLVEDACFTFGRTDWDGRSRTAAEVHAMSLAHLDGEYCTAIGTSDVLRAAAATDTVDNLILDLLEFVSGRERTYEEVIAAAWRTSCSRLPVWEDACDRRLIEIQSRNGCLLVQPTDSGIALLQCRRRPGIRKT